MEGRPTLAKYLVEVATLGCWGVRIKPGVSGKVLLLEAVGTIVQLVELIMKQAPYHRSYMISVRIS